MIVPLPNRSSQGGFTLIEATVTLTILGLLFGLLANTVLATLDARDQAQQREALARDAALALQRMVVAIGEAPGLLLPLAEDPVTAYSESTREQYVPAKPGAEDRSAVLAVRLGTRVDRDADGVPDADNDADGRIDEDPGRDASNDGHPGLAGVDDDHDGAIDEGLLSPGDDDEDGADDEDPLGAGDEDSDYSVDEDTPGDRNSDGAPGLAGVDDDGDGSIDEGAPADDDEDGASDEDWLDPVVFYLEGSNLVERQPFPRDQNGDFTVDGRDALTTVIAEHVSYLRIERIDAPRAPLIAIALELSRSPAITVRLETRVRVGGRT